MSSSFCDAFATDLASTFIVCDIPPYKLRSQPMLDFFKKYTNQAVPSETRVRKAVPRPFENLQTSIVDQLWNQKLWVTKRFLLSSDFFKAVNASTIVQFYQDTLANYEVNKNDVLVFTSDAAPYIVRAFTRN